jgi:hypothetical protein
MNALELPSLARKIISREETIKALERHTADQAAAWLREIILQGQDLIRARSKCKHGDWQDWLAANCPETSYIKATRYMRVAANAQRFKDLSSARSLRQALALCDEDNQDGHSARSIRRWPIYLEAISRVAKFVGYVERCPIKEWPEQGVEKLRKELLPVASELWPSRFIDNGSFPSGSENR